MNQKGVFMELTKRNIVGMIPLLLLTFGIYLIYWTVVTKNELNRLGAQIPTAWLFIIPFANIYFLYKFAQGFTIVVFKDDSQTIAYFLLFLFFMPLAPIFYQIQINKVSTI